MGCMPRVLTVVDLCNIAPQTAVINRDEVTGCISQSIHTYGFGIVQTDYVENVDDSFTTTTTAYDLP